MPTWSNRHITKFNQLVDVYEPAGIEPLETIQSQDASVLQRRRDTLEDYRNRVKAPDVGAFFDEQRQRELRDSESHPAPEEVADSQRDDMLDRLGSVEQALTDAIDGGAALDTDDGFDW